MSFRLITALTALALLSGTACEKQAEYNDKRAPVCSQLELAGKAPHGRFGLAGALLSSSCSDGLTPGPNKLGSGKVPVTGTFAFNAAPAVDAVTGVVAKWTPLPEAVTYTLKIATNRACSPALVFQSGISEHNLTLPTLDDGDYFLCLEAVTITGQHISSSDTPLAWHLDASPPGSFHFAHDFLVSADTAPTIEWTAAADAVGYDVTVQQLIAYPRDVIGSVLQEAQNLTTPSLKLNALADGIYGIDLRAIDVAGNGRPPEMANDPLGMATLLVDTTPTGTWSPAATTGAPSSRSDAVVAWTGSKLLVWGGEDDHAPLATGGVFDPAAGTWVPLATANAPAARSTKGVWTGTKLLVWGGSDFNNGTFTATQVFATGGLYDPAADSWSATSTTGAPSGRWAHTVTWMGSKALIWGGLATPTLGAATGVLATGGIYDPAANTWSAVSANATGTPAARAMHTVVWTGSKLLIWGGIGMNADSDTMGALASGDVYDPATHTWSTMATNGAPEARYGHTAVWTGSKMIVWGGLGSAPLASGGIYDPATNTWESLDESFAPFPRVGHVAVWTGAKMLIWGGGDSFGHFFDSGAVYNPATDKWDHLTLTGAPGARWGAGGAWTGSKLLLFGGDSFYAAGTAGTTFGASPALTP